MTSSDQHPRFQRRDWLKAATAAVCSLGVSAASQAQAGTAKTAKSLPSDVEPFFGRHQGGIATPIQRHTYFVAFDMLSDSVTDLIGLLQRWTDAAAQLTAEPAHFDAKADPNQAGGEPGAAVGLPVSRLTITFGFGPTLFEKAGKDRFGLNKKRPEALVDLPLFHGDQLVPERTGGDLSVQVSADDFQVVEYAIRRLVKLARGVADMRWAQTGFTGGFRPGTTGRNQMGFLDGTINVPTQNEQEMNRFVWAGDEGPNWMQGGSYMVIRPIRIALEHWDDMKASFQEETVGRHKASGAPIGKQHESDALGLNRLDKDGNPVVAEFSHAALSAPETNEGAQILRRAFNYDNGIMHVAERWPPWRQLVTFDAGLLFQCYQKDPRTGFIRIFAKMSQFDMLNQFVTHTGGGVFACPPGVKGPGDFIGRALFA